jgi:UDP-N-acetylmuramoyl-tripeptide--D-alanyl-D-alanine ligase
MVIPPEGRTRVIETGGITIVDDAYNANPGSVAAAIETLRMADGNRRVLILGDMLELGHHTPQLHGQIVASAERAGVDVLIGVGQAMTEAIALTAPDLRRLQTISCADVAAAERLVGSVLRPCDVVWLKGSRAVGLDGLVRYLESQWGPRSAVA